MLSRKTLFPVLVICSLILFATFAFTSANQRSSLMHRLMGKDGKTMMEEIPWDSSWTGNEGMKALLSNIYEKTNVPSCRFCSCAIADELLSRPIPEKWDDRYEYHSRLVSELINCGRMETAMQWIDRFDAEMTSRKVDNKFRRKWLASKGIAFLRYAEVTNCIQNHNEESCIFPLSEKAQHRNETGARAAIKLYSQILEMYPDDLASRWLLNIAYMQIGGYPQDVPVAWLIDPAAINQGEEVPAFRNIASTLGVDFPDMCGSVIMDDFNNDGLIDIFQSGWGLQEQVHFLINKGDGSFEDRTAAAGLEGYPGGLMMQQTDYNNDGLLDVFILRGAWYGAQGVIPNSLLHNNGDGTFTDVTRETGLYSCHPTQTATWADFNNDGWIDVFIGNEASRKKTDQRNDSELYLNDHGHFRNVAAASGANVNGFIKGVSSGDYDNDGDPDIYVSINGSENILLRNDSRRGSMELHFTDVTREAGVADPVKSFPCMFFDANNDGWLDILTFSYSSAVSDNDIPAEYLGLPRQGNDPALYINNGNGTFSNETIAWGLDKTFLVMGCNYGDFDMDGWQDFYTGTGKPSLRSIIPNRMFRNDNGTGYVEVTSAARVGHLQKGHGISFADLNNDGYPEIYAQMGGAYESDGFQDALYENPASWGTGWITLDLTGNETNKAAIGARVEVVVKENGKERHIYDWVVPGASFGANSLRLEIGLRQAEEIVRVEVYWPGSDEVQSWTGLHLRHHYRLQEGKPAAEELVLPEFDFPATSHQSNHHHMM